MIRRIASASLALACLFAAPVAFADGEEAPASELQLAAEGYSVALAVPASLTADVNEQLAGGTLDIDMLRCLEHPLPDGTVADSGCDPFSMEMVLADYQGIAASFEGQPYTIDFQAIRVSTGGGAAIAAPAAPALPETGLNTAAKESAGPGVAVRVGVVVLAVVAGAGFGIRSKRRAKA